MKRIDVPVKDGLYPVYVGPDALTELLPHLGGYTKYSVITQRGWPDRYAAILASKMRDMEMESVKITLPAGERAKSWRQVRVVTEAMADAGMDRRSLVIGVGGGVVTDVAGFCAAVYMRGVDVMHVSTTLLGQVDAAVGGKTGINISAGKNLVGAFWQPRAVAADISMLSTMSRRQLLAGLAEVVKYGWIMDPGILELCDDQTLSWDHPDRLTDLVARCISHKASIVSQDERESGIRAILNFGHTLGHALETLGGYRRLLHGEAVAVGMLAAVRIGMRLGVTPPHCEERMELLHRHLGLPVQWPEWAKPEDTVCIARNDKKNTGKHIRMVLLADAGQAQLPIAVDEALIHSVLRDMHAKPGRSV